MKKKILIFILCLFIFTIQSISSAMDVNTFRLTKPEKDIYQTMDDLLLINGSAKKNTELEIKHFVAGVKYKDFENYKEKYPKMDDFIKHFEDEKVREGDYEELSKTSINVGSLGIFSKKLTLMKGLNKILISDKAKEEKIIYIYLTDADKLSVDIKGMKTIDLIKNLR